MALLNDTVFDTGELCADSEKATALNSLMPNDYKLEDVALLDPRAGKRVIVREGTKVWQSTKKDSDYAYDDKLMGKIQGKRVRTECTTCISRSKDLEECENILYLLKTHPSAKSFLLPSIKSADTATSIRQVEEKLKARKYESGYHFALDLRNVWTNSWMSSAPESEPYAAATEVGDYFEELMRDEKHKKLLETFDESVLADDVSDGPSCGKRKSMNKGKVDNVSGKKKKRKQKKKKEEEQDDDEDSQNRPMSINEKAKLKANILKLPSNKLSGLLPIIKETVSVEKGKDELEFDIDALPAYTCRRLENYVSQMLSNNNFDCGSDSPYINVMHHYYIGQLDNDNKREEEKKPQSAMSGIKERLEQMSSDPLYQASGMSKIPLKENSGHKECGNQERAADAANERGLLDAVQTGWLAASQKAEEETQEAQRPTRQRRQKSSDQAEKEEETLCILLDIYKFAVSILNSHNNDMMRMQL